MTQAELKKNVRFLALKVASYHYCNRYRLIGLAKPGDVTSPLGVGNLPKDTVVIVGLEEHWKPVVTLSMSGFAPGVLLTNAFGLTVEI